jgi:hypothetical protein
MAITQTRHNPFAHAWYVEINNETYEVINKWWKTQTTGGLYYKGYCGFYLDRNLNLQLGVITNNDLIKDKDGWYDFGIELSFNDFVKYVLNEEPYLPKPLNIDRLLIILNYINKYEK